MAADILSIPLVKINDFMIYCTKIILLQLLCTQKKIDEIVSPLIGHAFIAVFIPSTADDLILADTMFFTLSFFIEF